MILATCQHSPKKHGRDRKATNASAAGSAGRPGPKPHRSCWATCGSTKRRAAWPPAAGGRQQHPGHRAHHRPAPRHDLPAAGFLRGECRRFLDRRMRGLTLQHLEFDEQHTFVAKKAARIHVDERRERHDQGDMFIWTCIDKDTKLMPSFLIGKRTGDNARRFMQDVSFRLKMPRPQNWLNTEFEKVVQISPMDSPAIRKPSTWPSVPIANSGRSSRISGTPSRQPGDYSPAKIVGTTRRHGTECVRTKPAR